MGTEGARSDVRMMTISFYFPADLELLQEAHHHMQQHDLPLDQARIVNG